MSAPQPRGRPPWPDVLTPAEWRVADAVRHGMTNRLIASRQGCSPDAVKFHVANVLAKLGLSNRKQLQQWSGVRRDTLLAARRGKMTRSLALGPLGQVSRSVRDIGEATRFYAEVLGLTHLYTFGELAFFDLGGVRLYLQQETEPGPQSVLYLKVDDIHGAHEALVAKGVPIASAPHLIHRHPDGMEEWMAFFHDPEGRMLALMCQVKP